MKRGAAFFALSLAASCTVRGVVGVVAEEGDVVTDLPRLPTIEVVSTVTRGGSVEVTLAPVVGAKDYRIYVLPRDEDIRFEEDGYVGVTGAIYRCSGDREAPLIPTDGEMQVQSGAIDSSIVGEVAGYTRRAADAVLGYVYTRPGAGRIPVYALADGAMSSDNSCYFHRYTASRTTRYTTRQDERAALIASGHRDDGIAFYAPDVASFDTRTVYAVRVDGLDTELFIPSGDELAAFAVHAPSPRFEVLAARADERVPLTRLHYVNACGEDHDVLAVGEARAAHVQQQGRYALPYVHYAGLVEPTTLVVEALDTGCPFRGHLSPEARDVTPAEGLEPMRQAWVTLDALASMSPLREVFVNGQHAPDNRPRAIARTFVRVVPDPEAHDFHEPFDAPIAPPTHTTYSRTTGGPAVDHVYDFPTFDARLYGISGDAHAIGTMLGELFVSHGDAGAQTQSKLRLTPRVMGVISDDSFLHARMDVDIVTTDRRFPQILISDRPIPVEESLADGYAIIAQVHGSWPASMQIAFCDGELWDATNNCPFRDLSYRPDGAWSPTIPVAERAGVDRVSRLEVFASTARVYALLDGEPHGCVDLPPGRITEGPVSVTFGDVLFHSGVDVDANVLGQDVYAFHRAHMQIETRRHIDDVAFSSGVPAPAWDVTRVPCFTAP